MTEAGRVLPVDPAFVLSRLPHRYPFLLIDRVTLSTPGVRAEGFKNVSMSDPFLEGHFPGRPIMPAVLQIEALAQLCGFALPADVVGEGVLGALAGIDGARFRRPVVPGDRLELRVEITGGRLGLWKIKGRATVDGQRACEAELLIARLPASAGAP